MDLKPDWEGEEAPVLSNKDGDIVGPAGQATRGAAKPGTEQIAAWGGFKEAETEVNETEERTLSVQETGAQGDQ